MSSKRTLKSGVPISGNRADAAPGGTAHLLRPRPHPAGRRPRGAGRRDRRRARQERRRQDHHAALDHRARAPAARPRAARGKGRRRLAAASHRAPGRGLRARRPHDLSRAHRGREHPGRAARPGEAVDPRAPVRALSLARRAPAQQGRATLGRRAADAGGGARAGHRSAHHAARRALAGPRAAGGRGADPPDPAAARRGRELPPGRAEPAAGRSAGRCRVRDGQGTNGVPRAARKVHGRARRCEGALPDPLKMDALPDALSEVLKSPGAFAVRCLKAFRANQGLLLAGAVAYYALLSIVPLLILVLIVLSHWLDRALLLDTVERYLGWLFPGQAKPVVAELASFIEHREVLGWVLAGTLIFFSSLAFTVLE